MLLLRFLLHLILDISPFSTSCKTQDSPTPTRPFWPSGHVSAFSASSYFLLPHHSKTFKHVAYRRDGGQISKMLNRRPIVPGANSSHPAADSLPLRSQAVTVTSGHMMAFGLILWVLPFPFLVGSGATQCVARPGRRDGDVGW